MPTSSPRSHIVLLAYVCVVTALAPPLIISYPDTRIASRFGHAVLRTHLTGARWVALTNRTIEADLMPPFPHFAASARFYCVSLLFDLKPIARLHSSPPLAHQEKCPHLVWQVRHHDLLAIACIRRLVFAHREA